MNQASAIIIADSISPEGIRLTTFQLQYWRPIHSELMTHRVFSRNAGSSRARPSRVIIEQVRNEPWGPIHWGTNQSGMQAHAEVADIEEAEERWFWAAQQAADAAEGLLNFGLHKQIVNRVLEPYTFIDVVLTATDYANWFALRDHADAQPEIRELAQLMREVYDHSEPVLLVPGQWHLPYITDEDYSAAEEWMVLNHNGMVLPNMVIDLLKKASAARCARVSYKLHDGSKTDFEKDLELFERLLVSQPLHASPAEHQATPDEWVENATSNRDSEWLYQHEQGNLRGWRQYRKMLPNEFVRG